MAYQKQIWENLPSTNTPLNADRLNHMEDGIYNASIMIHDSYSASTTEPYSANYVNSLNTYSTTEQRVGTWIDNKPLYRNYVDLGTLPNATRKNVNTGFPSDISIKKMEAYCYSETIGSTQTLPVVNNVNANGQVRIVYYSSQVSIFTSIDYSNWKGYAFVYYTKATD